MSLSPHSLLLDGENGMNVHERLFYVLGLPFSTQAQASISPVDDNIYLYSYIGQQDSNGPGEI